MCNKNAHVKDADSDKKIERGKDKKNKI